MADSVEELRSIVVRHVNQGLDDFRMGRTSNDGISNGLVEAIIIAGLVPPSDTYTVYRTTCDRGGRSGEYRSLAKATENCRAAGCNNVVVETAVRTDYESHTTEWTTVQDSTIPTTEKDSS